MNVKQEVNVETSAQMLMGKGGLKRSFYGFCTDEKKRVLERFNFINYNRQTTDNRGQNNEVLGKKNRELRASLPQHRVKFMRDRVKKPRSNDDSFLSCTSSYFRFQYLEFESTFS